MLLPSFPARLLSVGECKISYKVENGQYVYDDSGQPIVTGYSRELTFDDNRMRPEVFGPLWVFGPAARDFALPVGTEGLLTLEVTRKRKRDATSAEARDYFMSVDLVDFVVQ